MRMGYTWYNTNRRMATSAFERNDFQTNTYTVRASVETAGAFLFAMSKLFQQKREDDAYKIFGIQYAQYLKGEIDYTINHRFSPRNSISFHAGGWHSLPLTATLRWCRSKSVSMPEAPTACVAGACAPSAPAATTRATP